MRNLECWSCFENDKWLDSTGARVAFEDVAISGR
jgi:hypothetical protein